MDILSLLPILLIFVVIYFFMIKPAKKRQQEAMQTQNSLRPGSEVRTVAGLFATVSEVEDDSVILEIAPGVHCRYLKSAIVAVLSTGDDEDHDGAGHDGAGHDGDEGDGDEDHDGAHGATDADAVDLDKNPKRGPSRDDGEQPS